MAKDIYEGTRLTKEVKLTGESKGGDSISVEIVYLRNGLEVKKETKSLASGATSLECAYEAPEVGVDEVKYELLRRVTKDTEAIDVESFVVYPKSGKLTVVSEKDNEPMPGFKFVVRKNGKQVGRQYETVFTPPVGPADCPFPLDSVDPGVYEIQAVSPYLIKSYVKPATASPQPHSRALEIKADKMPYTVVLENPTGSETEPTDATKVYSTENPTSRGTGFLEVRIAASDRSKVVSGDAVNVEVECKRRSKRKDKKAPDVAGWVPKADWADGSDPYTMTRTWAKKLDISSGTVSFDIYLGVAGGDEFIIRAGMVDGQWDHQAKIVTWRKIKVVVVRPLAALVGTFSDDSKVLDEGVDAGVWESLAAAYRAAYIDCVAHSRSRRFSALDLGGLTSRGIATMLRWTLPATVFGKASSEPDDLVFSKEAQETVLKSSWVVNEAGTVNGFFVGKIVANEERMFMAREAPSEELRATLPNKPGVFWLDEANSIHPGNSRCPALSVAVTHYDDSGTWKPVKTPAPKFGVTNFSALAISRVGDKTTIDLTSAKYKLLNKGALTGSEISGLFTADSGGKISLGVEQPSIKKSDNAVVSVGTKLKIGLDGALMSLSSSLGGYADGSTTINALRAPSDLTGRPSNAKGTGLVLAHEIAHFLGFAYLNPSDKGKPQDDGTAEAYTQAAITGVEYKTYFDGGGTGYFGRGGSGPHCNIGMTTDQKKAEQWLPTESSPIGVKLDPWPECIMFGYAHPEPAKVEFCADCLRVLREADILESRDGRVK